jgi:type II secretory pathway component PulF
MIAFAARSDNFIDRLRIASQDRIEYAERKAQRTLRVAQTMSVMVAFVIALILIPAVYMPLFNMRPPSADEFPITPKEKRKCTT